MYLVDVQGEIEKSETLSELVERVSQSGSGLYEELQEDESLWIFAPSTHCDGEYWPAGMAIADALQDEAGFTLKNVVSRVKQADSEPHFADISEEIFFLVKDKRDYHFDKDAIRVEHVYEDNEWTDRTIGNSSYHDYESRRYNPKGKDPGNVWLRESRSRTDDETLDETKSLPRTEAVRRCVRAGSKEGELVVTVGFSSDIKQIVEEEDRVCKQTDWGTIRGRFA